MTNAERDQRRALLELAAGRVSAARDPLRDLGTTRSLAIEGELSRIEQRLEREAARLGCATKCVKVPECEVRCEAAREGAWKLDALLTPEEFAAIPNGTVLYCIDGTTVTKGKDKIYGDTRWGYLAYGIRRADMTTGVLLDDSDTNFIERFVQGQPHGGEGGLRFDEKQRFHAIAARLAKLNKLAVILRAELDEIAYLAKNDPQSQDSVSQRVAAAFE